MHIYQEQININPPDVATAMKFLKFKDLLHGTPLKRLNQKDTSNTQKLAQSIKRRVFRIRSPTKWNFVLTGESGMPQRQNCTPKNHHLTKRKLQLQQQQKHLAAQFCAKSENGEEVENIVISDEEDCILYEPHITNIDLDDDAEDHVDNVDNADGVASKKPEASEHDTSDELPTNSGFVIDKKPGFILKTDQPIYNKKEIDDDDDECIVIEDSFDLSKRTESPSRIVDDRKKLALVKPPTPHTVSLDDSVIFVEEHKSGTEDFIPLPTDDKKQQTRRRQKRALPDAVVEATMETKKRINDNFYTTAERKKLADYNSNTYNPETSLTLVPTTNKRPIIIDGSNVAFAHGCSSVFSSEGIKYCVEYFQKMGHYVRAIVPQFRANPNKSSNPELILKLHKEGILRYTPCKRLENQSCTSYDDRIILQLAYELNAAVVSNDNYRDLLLENSAFKKIIENRIIGYTWCDNILMLPKDPYGRFGPSLSEILHC